ncbi:MAG: hypothetical protein ACRD0U_14805, partial [Acidimicrobiales bacterium]
YIYHHCGFGYGYVEGSWSMTSANGDGLSGEISQTPSCSGPQPYSVTAGTGAFAGYTAPPTAQPNFPGPHLGLGLPTSVGSLHFTLTPP